MVCRFFDAESCFYISYKKKEDRILLKIRITTHIDELPLLNFLHSKLGCGSVYKSKTKCEFVIMEQKALINLIIPILDNFNLNTTKHLNYLDFKKALDLMKKGSHLIPEGKLEIINIKALMNKARTNNPMPSDHSIRITPNWLIRFIEGDGSFYVNNLASRLSISQSIKDYSILEGISKYFDSGTLRVDKITNRYKMNSQWLI
jgi:hypothetical protein